jgi:hypothetical protein
MGWTPPQAHTWLAAQRETLLHGDPQVVLGRLRSLQEDLRLQAGEGPPPPALAVLSESLDYLAKRADHLRYAAFRALGYPIGSGAVESANKLVVEARLKGAGRHRAPEHVNPLLALRSMACSDRWEEGWPQLTGQWRAQPRAATLEHRRLRQAARQATPTPQTEPPRPTEEVRLLVAGGSVPLPPAAPPPRPSPPSRVPLRCRLRLALPRRILGAVPSPALARIRKCEAHPSR